MRMELLFQPLLQNIQCLITQHFVKIYQFITLTTILGSVLVMKIGKVGFISYKSMVCYSISIALLPLTSHPKAEDCLKNLSALDCCSEDPYPADSNMSHCHNIQTMLTRIFFSWLPA